MERRRKKLVLLPRYLIVCEGAVTEALYFHGIRKNKRLSEDLIEVERAAGVPLSVVKRAVELKIKDATLPPEERYKEVWCVFDRDEHPAVEEAFALANKHGLEIAFSNPCFELFLLFHFCDCNTSEHRREIARRLKRYIREYEKSFDFEKLGLWDAYPSAKLRCEFAEQRRSIKAGIPSAPYSSVYRLVDLLRDMPTSPFRK